MQMVKVFYGSKGMGKTKVLVETANNLAASCSGDIVFIDYSNELMYNLKHKIRFINVSEFPIMSSSSFLGFICGIVAEDYDIDSIFIDGITYILKENDESLASFFSGIQKVVEKHKIKFYISMNGDPKTVPEYVKEYIA